MQQPVGEPTEDDEQDRRAEQLVAVVERAGDGVPDVPHVAAIRHVDADRDLDRDERDGQPVQEACRTGVRLDLWRLVHRGPFST
ncbi:MAG: hypothetical protein M5U08_03130 [Burkholderiales bacterium]|nr:hypothetical protein [Burkholderiales bacterium]